MFILLTIVFIAAGLGLGFLGYQRMQLPETEAQAWSLFAAGFAAICYAALFAALGVIVSELRKTRTLIAMRLGHS